MDDENKPAEEEVVPVAEAAPVDVAPVADAVVSADAPVDAAPDAPVVSDEPVVDSGDDVAPTPNDAVPESLLDHVRAELHKVATDLGLELEHLKDAFAAKL